MMFISYLNIVFTFLMALAGELPDRHLLQRAHHLVSLVLRALVFLPAAVEQRHAVWRAAVRGPRAQRHCSGRARRWYRGTSAPESACRRVPQSARRPPRNITWSGRVGRLHLLVRAIYCTTRGARRIPSAAAGVERSTSSTAARSTSPTASTSSAASTCQCSSS